MGLLLLYYLVFRAYQKEVYSEATISKGVVTETDLLALEFFCRVLRRAPQFV